MGDLTSTMIVAIKRVGSNILFSCFIGPMRKTVLQGKHAQAVQIRTEPQQALHPGCLATATPKITCGNSSSNIANIRKALILALLCIILIKFINNL